MVRSEYHHLVLQVDVLHFQPPHFSRASTSVKVRREQGVERRFAWSGTLRVDLLRRRKEPCSTVEITDPGKFPRKTAIAKLSVRPAGSRRSTVQFGMRFQPKFGPVGWLMGKTVMRSQFRKILGDVLAGLETHPKTGTIVNRKTKLHAA